MADDFRARRPTLPPLGPPPGTEARLAVLERDIAHLGEDVSEIVPKLGKVMSDVAEINKNLAVIVAQRDDATKAKGNWVKLAFGVLGTLAAALIIWIARIAFVVQSAKVLPPP